MWRADRREAAGDAPKHLTRRLTAVGSPGTSLRASNDRNRPTFGPSHPLEAVLRTLGILVGVVGVTLVAAFFVRGQPDRPAEPPRPRAVTASGSATVRGPADAARLHFTVDTFERTVPLARAKNAAAVKTVREAVAAVKVEGLRVRTTDSHVRAVTSREPPHEVTGFSVSQSLALVLTEADPTRLAATAERVLDAGLANGVNADGGVDFFRTDDSELRREAMRKAVEDAVESAKAFAAGAKVTVQEVVSIEDGERGDEPVFARQPTGTGNPFFGGGGGQAERPTFTAGAWEVTRRVRVVCRY